MTARRRRWTVGRTWWELTLLILVGGARYDLYLGVDDLTDAAQAEFNRENWVACHLDWTDPRDRFATLSAEPESGTLAVREAPDERVGQLEKQLSDERFTTAKLGADVDRLTKANNVLTHQLAVAREAGAALRRDMQQSDAAPCECGGDAELHLRRLVVAAEKRARLDRDNAVVMADRLAAAEGRPVTAVKA